MSRNFYVKYSGIWKPIKTPYVKQSGSWKTPTAVYIKNSGQWKQVWPAVFNLNLVISADTYNFKLYPAALAAGWDGVLAINATVTVNSGIVIGSADPSLTAFTIDGFPTASTVTLINNGYIVGAGGVGAWSGRRGRLGLRCFVIARWGAPAGA